MHEGIDLLAELYPRCFCRTNRRPLKIGACEEVISQQPEMSRHRIKRLLKTYTQSPEYCSTLAAGAPRIDLAGNVAGEVTAADEEDAKRKIAKEARQAAAQAIEHRKAESATVADLPPSPVAAALQPTASTGAPRLGLAGLKGPHKLAGRGSSPRSDPRSIGRLTSQTWDDQSAGRFSILPLLVDRGLYLDFLGDSVDPEVHTADERTPIVIDNGF
jgi:sRNA-binding protein